MEWVVKLLENTLRKEKFFGAKHAPLKADKKRGISAKFSEERIPQLKTAIKILQDYRQYIVPKVKKKAKVKISTKQLNLFK